LERLLDYPEELEGLRERSLLLARPRAATCAAEAIIKLAQSSA
jgi:hypothetical protein